MATRFTKTRYTTTQAKKTAPAKKAPSGMSTQETVRYFETELEKAEIRTAAASTPEQRTESLKRELFCIEKLIFFKPFLATSRGKARNGVSFPEYFRDAERQIRTLEKLECCTVDPKLKKRYKEQRAEITRERDTVRRLWPGNKVEHFNNVRIELR